MFRRFLYFCFKKEEINVSFENKFLYNYICSVTGQNVKVKDSVQINLRLHWLEEKKIFRFT